MCSKIHTEQNEKKKFATSQKKDQDSQNAENEAAVPWSRFILQSKKMQTRPIHTMRIYYNTNLVSERNVENVPGKPKTRSAKAERKSIVSFVS